MQSAHQTTGNLIGCVEGKISSENCNYLIKC